MFDDPAQKWGRLASAAEALERALHGLSGPVRADLMRCEGRFGDMLLALKESSKRRAAAALKEA